MHGEKKTLKIVGKQDTSETNTIKAIRCSGWKSKDVNVRKIKVYYGLTTYRLL